jgi:hypothetical protein
MEEYPHKELSHDIIGAAMKVLNSLKPGLDEKSTRTPWSSS